MLASLVDRGELEKPDRGEYRLVEGELLHNHLKLRITEKKLTKKNQKLQIWKTHSLSKIQKEVQ